MTEIAEVQISHDCYTLQQIITNLWKARLNPQTADLILSKETDIWSAAGSLARLLEDIRESNAERDQPMKLEIVR